MRGRTLLLAVAISALVLGRGAAPAAAQSKTCPELTPTYTDACGPTFVLPSWGDAGGWMQPEQYETIQLADVDGDKDDELLARTPAGVAVHDFDKTLGQWRPQVTPAASPTDPQDIKYVPVLLTEFANPPPLTTANPNPPTTDWTLPQYYDTIQAADVDGDTRAEILGRSAAGLTLYKFTPTPGVPGQGTWNHVSTSSVFSGSDWDDPSGYSTIQTGDLDGNGHAEVFGRQSDGIVAFRWKDSAWSQLHEVSFLGDPDGGKDPAYYTSIQAANVAGGPREELLGRDRGGVSALRYTSSTDAWTAINRLYQPFTDHGGGPDCPFTSQGDPCFSSAPAYYKTIQFADVDGNGNAELLGRASDGMRALRYQGDTPDAWGRLATLSDLSDAKGYTAQQYWETIQFADINGDRRAEALARGPQGLDAWSYDPGKNAWTKLAPTTQLSLADDPWGGDPSYYSTIETGDVNGDKRADVVARGPYGIRTWFYDRRGTGGWERYLAEGYPAFPCRPAGDPNSCQRAAFDELNRQAQGQIPGGGSNVRDVWLGTNPPSLNDLTNLAALVTRIGNCTNQSQSNPTQYGTCTPPPNSSGFTAADWQSVVNEILAETFWAGQVWDHFYDPATGLQQSWSVLIQEQLAQLPVIADSLRLDPVEQMETEFNPGEFFSTGFGIAGALVELAEPAAPEIVPLLELTSELTSLLPSAAPALVDNRFEVAYGNLQKQLADGIQQADDALSEHSYLVRGDLALLTLVGQLRARGTWQLDTVGMRGVGRQGFATWIYKTLLPVIWASYAITGCEQGGALRCTGPPSGPWVLQDSTVDFTAMGPQPTSDSPCVFTSGRNPFWTCNFLAPPVQNAASIVFGRMAQNCAYDGQNPNTIWKFPDPDPTKGGCTLGVDPRLIVGDPSAVSASARWSIPGYTGTPVVSTGAAVDLAGSANGIGGDGTVVPSASASGRDRAAVRLRGTVALARGLRLGRAKVVFDRLLFERGGAGELVRHGSGRRLAPLRLSRRRGTATGGFVSRRGRGPNVRLRLRRRGQGRLSFRLRARDVRLPSPPTACRGTRPGVDLATEPIPLHTRLRIDDGRRRPLVISLRPQWACRRDRLGNVRRLVLQPPKYRAPRGRRPAIAVRGPRRVTRGRRATYSITVRNRRRTPAYDVLVRSVLPRELAPRRTRGARVSGGNVVWRWRVLQPGRSRTVRLRVRVARSAAGRACLAVAALAIDTRSASERICSRIKR